MLDAPRTITDLRALLSKFREEQIMEALRILIEDGKAVERKGRFYHIDDLVLRGGGE